jgi:hypothetical protein
VFARDPRAYVWERHRLRYFPAMARKMPELRRTLLHRRVFLSRRSSRLDLALAGGLLAWAMSTPVPLAATLPYLRMLAIDAQRSRPERPRAAAVAAADLAADLVGLAALLEGSLEHRSLVI